MSDAADDSSPSGPAPPNSEAELVRRAGSLAGLTIGIVAARHGVPVPGEMLRAKGFVGTLLERALGASAKSRAAPDFEALGVELKSLPVDASGQPLETTFVCTIPLLDVGDTEWAASRVYHKLRRVLWVPVMSERSRPLPERIIGTALLWSPSLEEEAELRWDWEELSGIIGRGGVDSISGRLGHALQVRPKAANSRARRVAVDDEGRRVEVLPRGFYLRTSFTSRILRQHFRVAHGSVGEGAR